MTTLWRFLQSTRLALVDLSFLAVYCGAAAWLPWSAPGGAAAPRWAIALGLDRPFSAPLFLVGVLVLFLSTVACTVQRTWGVLRLFRGEVLGRGVGLPARPAVSFEKFVVGAGFRPKGEAFFRYRWALWGGWLLHVGLLALIAGVLVQQAFHDGGAFEVAEGATVDLRAPGVVFGRDPGWLAPAAPPDLRVTLDAFDPFLHQRGYAPDRGSRLRVGAPGALPRDLFVDRAAGVEIGRVTVYQAIPSGLALQIELAGLGVQTFHLREAGSHAARASFVAPNGEQVLFEVGAERPLLDRFGTGPLTVRLFRGAAVRELEVGAEFRFGATPARLAGIGRWGGFTYALSPGVPAVFSGFGLILAGAALMTLPAGVAKRADASAGVAGWVWVARGRDLFVAEWSRTGSSSEG